MKKQDASSLPSSSSRRENSPKTTLRAKSIGCMSGIFHLVYNYNNRRGKFLTFGKKQEKNRVSCPSQQDQITLVSGKVAKFSCDVPRSPTLPAEIRRSITLKSPENLRTTPPQVGLDEVDRETDLTVELAAEKRKKLLEALEKCDEDLKALKEIIDVVKSGIGLEDDNVYCGDQTGLTCKQQLNGDLQPQPQPSPVSVLDDFTLPSTLSSYSRRYTNGRATMQQQQQNKKQKKKPAEEEDITNLCLAGKMTTNMSDESIDIIIQAAKMNQNDMISPPWGSKAMIDSVNQVCRDMAWGERREIGRLGLVLQDFICKDLIEETVADLIGSYFSVCMYSLPFQACQRSLRF